jgi:16S rRNA (cytosine967-C5)-methyltransferase
LGPPISVGWSGLFSGVGRVGLAGVSVTEVFDGSLMVDNMSPPMANFQRVPPERSNSLPPGLAARRAALRLLQAVLRRRRPLDDALDETPELDSLDGRDRGFARLLAATTLRRLGQIDALINDFVRDPVKARDQAAQELMRLGACQLLFLGTPAHAAIDATVGLAEHEDVGHLKGLINAVLRRIDREGAALVAAQDEVALNIPDWLRSSWSAAYGEAAMRAIGQAILVEPMLDISVKDESALDDWAARLDGVLLPTGTIRRALGGQVTELPGFSEGAWWIQDAAAALPAKLLGEVRGRRVLDLCAAPGGKTAQLAARGAEVTAIDRSAPRLKRLEQNLTRLNLSATSLAIDAALYETDQPFDAMLLDAPCSATGTVRRHPDILQLKQPGDLPRLVSLQDRLIEAAARLVKPGGTIVYCTCSLEPAEGPERIEQALARLPSLARMPIAAGEVGGLSELITEAGDLRTLPSHLSELGGLDGFYAARLVKAP